MRRRCKAPAVLSEASVGSVSDSNELDSPGEEKEVVSELSLSGSGSTTNSSRRSSDDDAASDAKDGCCSRNSKVTASQVPTIAQQVL